MGCIDSTERSHSNDIDIELMTAKQNNDHVRKLLFFGKSGAGKSTSFKQLQMIHGANSLDKDRIRYKDYIYSHIIQQIKLLTEKYEELKEESPTQFGHLQLSKNGMQSAQFIDYLRNDVDINETVAMNIETLWKEAAIKEIFDNRAGSNINDSSGYFFDKINRIGSKSYIPTDKDMLYVRRPTNPTNGIMEQKFEVHGTKFEVLDISSQMSITTRSKWIHCFEHVSAVLFVVSLSCYDEILYEDEFRNRMHESLDFFEEICNSRWFINTAMILILNKSDLFALKIQRVPLSVCFKEYHGSDSYDDCLSHVRMQFEQRNRNSRDKQVYSFVTCATDKDNVNRLFSDIQHILTNASLSRGGLI
eukprot:465822_1